MKDIQKYSPSLDWGDPSMEKDDNGDWHKVSDVEKLLAQRDELLKAAQTVVDGYEGDGMEGMEIRDNCFYEECKKALKG